jgi:hypothetical protein
MSRPVKLSYEQTVYATYQTPGEYSPQNRILMSQNAF